MADSTNTLHHACGFVFAPIGDGKAGRFHLIGDGAGDVTAAFHALLDCRDKALINEDNFSSKLETFAAQHPWFVSAQVYLASIYLERQEVSRAYHLVSRVLQEVEAFIPNDFQGVLDWSYEENQTYLRLLHVQLLCCIQLQRHADAVSIMQKLLHLCPDDHLGIKLLLGPELLRCNEIAKAKEILQTQIFLHPSYRYEFALCHLTEKNWVAAATALRQAFAANIYIAQRLCGHPCPKPLNIWHAGPHELPQAADDYMASYGSAWEQNDDCSAFVHWLYHHPAVMQEMADILACKVELRWERNGSQRDYWLTILDQRRSAMDDTLSRKIVVQHADTSGRIAYPWQLNLYGK